MTEYTNNPIAREEIARVAGSVGGYEPLADRIADEKRVEALPQGDRRRNSIIRRMRRKEPPTESQKDLKRFLGFGLIATLTAGAALLFQQSGAHFDAAHLAALDYKTVASHINILNLADSLTRMANDKYLEAQNNLIGWAAGIGGVVTTGIDGYVTIFKRPWKKPLRRGRFF